MKGLIEGIAEVQCAHRYRVLPGRCRCQELGEFMRQDQHDTHVAEQITDLLIDMAGTGQLLSSMGIGSGGLRRVPVADDVE